MAAETEIERMVIRLVGDGSLYRDMMTQAATTTASVATSIQRNTGTIQKFTSTIQGYASGAVGSLKGLINTMGSLTTMGLGSVGAGGAAGLLGLGGIAGLASAGGWGLSLAREAEKASISFEVMLGSAEKGKRMLEEIQDFAAKTPFEMPGLRSAAQMMLNFGVSQDKIMPTLKALGDVSAGDQNKLNGLAYAYSQTQAAGRLMGQDLMQMVNWGFNPLEEMARKSGKSLQQMREQMAAGKISAKMVEEAFISASGPGGKFFNMMQKQSETFDGLMSTMADTVKLEVTKIGTMLIEKLDLRGFLKSAIAAGEKVGPALSGAIGKALDWIVPKAQFALGLISTGISYLYPVFQSLAGYVVVAFNEVGSAFNKLLSFIGPIGPYIETVKSSIMTIVSATTQWVSENQGFLKTLGAIALSIGAIIAGKAALIPLLGAVTTAFALILNPITLAIAGITALTYWWTTYTESGKAAAEEVGKAINFIAEQFGILVKLVQLGEIELAWKVTTTTISLAWAETVNYLQVAWIGIKTFFAQLSLNIVNGFRMAFEMILLIGTSVVNGLIQAFNRIVPERFEIPEFDTTAAKASIQALAQEHQDSHKELLAMQDQEIANAAKPVEAAREAWQQAQKEAAKVIEKDANKEKGGFGSTWLGMGANLATDAIGMITEMAGPATEAAKMAGEGVGGAYTSGVKSQLQSLDAIQATATNAYNVIEGFRSKFAVSQNQSQTVNQSTSVVPPEKPLWETMASGISELVTQGREKAGNVLEIGIASLEG